MLTEVLLLCYFSTTSGPYGFMLVLITGDLRLLKTELLDYDCFKEVFTNWFFSLTDSAKEDWGLWRAIGEVETSAFPSSMSSARFVIVRRFGYS